MTGLAPGVRRVAVIGDVGGHADELTAELARLGTDGDGVLPDDLAVVQVGDLIHRGPDSERVVGLVDRYLREQPGQWVQLVGNHEAQYLGESVFDWPERIAPESVATLQRWWADGSMVAAVALDSGSEHFLITHAGLTAGLWRALDGLRSAPDAAEALNGLIAHDPATLFRPGVMLRTRRQSNRPRTDAGPLWAEATSELVAGWRDLILPFSQIHGHSSVVDWVTGAVALPQDDDGGSARVVLDPDARHATVRLTGGRIVGIDPNHGRSAHRWRSFELKLPAPGG